MTETTLRRVLAVVALVAAGYGVTVLMGGSGGTDRAAGPVPEALRRAAAGELDSVRIEGEDTVVLRRSGDAWRVDGHRADTADVARLREGLRTADDVEIASRNAENHARLGVDSAGARRVMLGLVDGEPVRLLAGDRGPYRSGVYLRVPGTIPVHLAPGPLGEVVRQGRDAWRDRTVAAVDTARVRVIRVRRGDSVYRLSRSGGAWSLDGAGADSARVRRLLGDLAGLAADGFGPDTADVEPADRSLTVLAAAGGDTLARLRMRRGGPEGTPRFLVVARGREGVFELDPPTADRLTPPRAELRAGRAAPGDSAPPAAGGGGP